MELTTKFSVAMSVYKNDDPQQLRLALESICRQSYLPSEVYLVIDGPIGEALEAVIAEFSEKYGFFTVNRLAKNGGLGNALAIAVENCKYDLIARMDSDDISAPGRFQKQIAAYEKEPADVLGGFTLGFVGDLETGQVSSTKRRLTHEEIAAQLKKGSPMSHVTVLLRREAVLACGNYQDLHYYEDYYLWARMILGGCTFRNIPEYLVYVRLGKDQARRHGGLKYFKSGRFLKKYMLENGLISRAEYSKSLAVSVVYHLLLPPGLRSFVSTHFKRKAMSREEANAIIEGNLSTEFYESTDLV